MPKPKLTRWRCTNRCKTSSTPLNIPSSSSRSLPDRTVDWFLPARVRSPEVSSHEVEMKPDFTAVDVPPPVLHGSPSDPVSAKDGDWTCFSAFIAGEGEDAADYARIILAALPFQLNAYGVVVSSAGSVRDRQGFIRLRVPLLWNATSEELGHDATVSLQSGHSYHQDTSVLYPRLEIRMGDPSGGSRTNALCAPRRLFSVAAPGWRTLGPASNDATVVKTS
ncbi:hypothetical protein BD413DRAFT_618143 [Trametes elegans]|nr:hypothetical protein BD413DRAFT_618143 [Trametes elegans]